MGAKESKQIPLTYEEAIKRGKNGLTSILKRSFVQFDLNIETKRMLGQVLTIVVVKSLKLSSKLLLKHQSSSFHFKDIILLNSLAVQGTHHF